MTTFWVEDITVLFRTLEFIPTAKMTKEETFNAYTRLLFIIVLISLLAKYKYWYVIAVVGLAVIICYYYSTVEKKNKTGSSGDPNSETLIPNQETGEYTPM